MIQMAHMCSKNVQNYEIIIGYYYLLFWLKYVKEKISYLISMERSIWICLFRYYEIWVTRNVNMYVCMRVSRTTCSLFGKNAICIVVYVYDCASINRTHLNGYETLWIRKV